MDIIFDTNILIELIRADNDKKMQRLYERVNPNQVDVYISIVSIGEAIAFAYQTGWGERKITMLKNIIDECIHIGITDEVIEKYIEIERYNMRKHPTLPAMNGNTQNMGKNDLWIASTASILEATLVTSDKDFNHLKDIFLNLDFVERDNNGSIIY